MKVAVLLTILFPAYFLSIAQEKDKREVLYVHTNGNVFLTGEDLLLHIFSRSQLTGQVSVISGITYVELLQDETTGLRQKVAMKNGIGNGELFLPTTLKTGTYTLIAYTQYMRNFGEVYSTDIRIINPYEPLQPVHAPENDPSLRLYFPGSGVCPGSENSFSFQISNSESVKRIWLRDGNGENLSQWSPNGSDWGTFTFIPRSGLNYELVIEDKSGNFQFQPIDLLKEPCGSSSMSESGRLVFVQVDSTTKVSLVEVTPSGKQRIHKMPEDGLFNIPKQELSWGLTKFYVLHENDTIGVHHYYTQPDFSAARLGISARPFSGDSAEFTVQLPAGTYSVSIRKQWKSISEDHDTSSDYLLFNSAAAINYSLDRNPARYAVLMNSGISMFNSSPSQITHLPESGKEIIQGLIKVESTKSLDKEVATLTIPGPTFRLYTSHLTQNGQFAFFMDPIKTDREATLSTSTAREDVNFEVLPKWISPHVSGRNHSFKLDSIQLMEISNRNLDLQLYRAYQLSQQKITENLKFEEFTPWNFFFNLDEYNRFPTLSDHFTEYIPSVAVRKNSFKFYYKNMLTGESYSPLILLDGVPVNQESILSISPYKIRSIGVINNRYFLGDLVADGVVSMETFEGKLAGFKIGTSTFNMIIEGTYDGSLSTDPIKSAGGDRLPDLRTQLLFQWIEIKSQGNYRIPFSTSDINGNYIIDINGFTNEGKPFHASAPIEIRKN